MTSTFLLTPEIEEAARKISAYAERSVNWYRPGTSTCIPGDQPEHVLISGTTRAVFSWTQHPTNPELVVRHLSVSVKREGRLPLPESVWTLAHLFGFTGVRPQEGGIVTAPGPRWLMDVNEDEECVVVQELVEELCT